MDCSDCIATETLARENSMLINLIRELANEVMEADDAGRFVNHQLAYQVNRVLGI